MSSPSLSVIREELESFYLPARNRVLERLIARGMLLLEDSDEPPVFQQPERFLQAIWNEQRLDGDLRTEDGAAVQVISPGTWNLEPGPDFKNAVLKIDGRNVRGDVEVHRSPADWDRHGHAGDPAYARVILHVVYQAFGRGQADGRAPCLVMADFLDRPLRELLDEIESDVYPYARRVSAGQCALQLAMLDRDRVDGLLSAAGLARFHEKIARMERAVRESGPEQALYEGLFEALGYKANRVPFKALARSLPLPLMAGQPDTLTRWAVFSGTAGLLPDPSVSSFEPDLRRRLRRAWDVWWQRGLPALELAWERTRTRPANRPENRLLAGLLLLEKASFEPGAWVWRIAGHNPEPGLLLKAFRRELAVGVEDATAVVCWWPGAGRQRLLGTNRIHDMLVNVVLPFLWVMARQAHDRERSDLVEQAYLAMPRLQENRAIKEVVHRLFVPPSRAEEIVRKACHQQGLLEIHRDFCLNLGNDCQICPLGRALPVADPG